MSLAVFDNDSLLFQSSVSLPHDPCVIPEQLSFLKYPCGLPESHEAMFTKNAKTQLRGCSPAGDRRDQTPPFLLGKSLRRLINKLVRSESYLLVSLACSCSVIWGCLFVHCRKEVL